MVCALNCYSDIKQTATANRDTPSIKAAATISVIRTLSAVSGCLAIVSIADFINLEIPQAAANTTAAEAMTAGNDPSSIILIF